MANEKNLIPQAHTLTVEEASKGGIASGKSRREKKMIKDILSDLLDGQIKDSPQFAKLASKMGIQSDKSVKDIFTLVCLLNSVKSGNLSDLEKLSRLLGEETQTTTSEQEKQSNLLSAIEKAVKNGD